MSARGAYRIGRSAETIAAWLLRLKGFRILAQRYATPVGEIDLIARRGELLVFVEVKRRAALGTATEALLPRQQQRVARAAAIFLQQGGRRASSASCRFDVVAVAPWRWPLHIEDAWRL